MENLYKYVESTIGKYSRHSVVVVVVICNGEQMFVYLYNTQLQDSTIIPIIYLVRGEIMILLERDVYDETIAILRNEKKLQDIFVELKDLIYKQFKVTAINFVYERIKNNNPENRYSLNVLLLNKGNYLKMCDGPYGGYRKSKQKFIAEKFHELALRYNFDAKEHIENIWICYTDFYSELRAEINSIASKEAIEYIKREYLSLPIWLICPQFTCVVIFYETDKHVSENNQNGMNMKLKQDYFSILKKYDEFGCYDYDSFQVFFDSKEALDRDYDGNLYYYFK